MKDTKNKSTFLSDTRKYIKKYEYRHTDPEMENLQDEHFPHCSAIGFNVEELRKTIRAKLLRPIRFLRNADLEYINIEEDNLADAHFVNDVEKNYAFLYAAFIDDTNELLQKLYLREVNVNFVYPGENFNALHLAALHGSSECARWLLEKGCQLADTSDGLSPLHFAVLSDSPPVCRLLVASGCNVDSKALHMAVWANALDCVEYFLELKAPVNEYDECGHTVLHIAAYVNNLKIIQALLRDNRVDVNAKTKFKKYTALHLAAENGYRDCLKMLLERGANIDALSAKKQTPLYYACKENFLDCVESLLEYGATVNALDDEKKTPLHAAVSRTLNPLQIHIVRRLIDRQADVHLADRFGYTALHVAALNELDECVEQLILSGANVAAKTNSGGTALNIMNRKTPSSCSKIKERLDLCLAYNQEQLLKFSFRDINRNSTVGEIGYLYTLQKEGQAKVLEHPICEAFLHLKWQRVRIFVLLRLAISLVTILLLSLLMSWGNSQLECYQELLTPILGVSVNARLYNKIFSNTTNSEVREQLWNTTLDAKSSRTFDIANFRSRKVCKNATLSIVPHSERNNVSTWYLVLFCDNKNISLSLKKSTYNSSCSADSGIVDEFFNTYRYTASCIWIFIMVMLVVNTVRIIFTLAAYKSMTHFFVKYTNIVEIFVTVCVPLTLINMHTIVVEKITMDYEVFQKSLASLTLLASWAYLMNMVSQLPSIGAYLAMFKKVLKEFLKLKIAFSCLLLGFAFTFSTLRADLFQNPIIAFIKILAMMTGELNSDNLLGDEDVSSEEYMTAFFLSVFTIIITIVLMNLLVGIAVSDVEGLRKKADLCKLIQQTKFIHFLEKTCFKGYFPPYMMDVLRQFLYIWPDSYTGVVMYVRPISPNETRLPRDVMDAGLKIALNRLKTKKLKAAGKKPTVEDRIYSLEWQVLKLQELVCTLQLTLEDVARNTSTLGSNNVIEAMTDGGKDRA